QGVVAALGAGRHRELAEGPGVRPPPRRFIGRGQAGAEEVVRQREHRVGREGRAMEVAHQVAHRGANRRNRRLLSTTLRLDHAMAALAITGESSRCTNGYATPAAIGIPSTL